MPGVSKSRALSLASGFEHRAALLEALRADAEAAAQGRGARTGLTRMQIARLLQRLRGKRPRA